jgi:hypothetical protein
LMRNQTRSAKRICNSQCARIGRGGLVLIVARAVTGGAHSVDRKTDFMEMTYLGVFPVWERVKVMIA